MKFREALVDLTLHEINMVFQGADLEPITDFVPSDVGGRRRTLVEQYYANVLWDFPSSVSLAVKAYENTIEHFEDAKNRLSPDADEAASSLNATCRELIKCMEADGFTFKDGRFTSPKLHPSLIAAPTLIRLTEASITEHLEKAKAKIESGDYAGAIASAYTLVEAFLKEILVKLNVPFNRDEGDIRKLYQLAADPLTLNPKGENLESFLKSILQGLKSQLTGLYELANKGSDRHARRYNPAAHHAKLAVNVAFTLCEFLLESFEYQQQRKRKAV